MPPDTTDPCQDGDPDTYCSDLGDPPPGEEPPYCVLYPSDPMCTPI